jgi:hypothetical protein
MHILSDTLPDGTLDPERWGVVDPEGIVHALKFNSVDAHGYRMVSTRCRYADMFPGAAARLKHTTPTCIPCMIAP